MESDGQRQLLYFGSACGTDLGGEEGPARQCVSSFGDVDATLE